MVVGKAALEANKIKEFLVPEKHLELHRFMDLEKLQPIHLMEV